MRVTTLGNVALWWLFALGLALGAASCMGGGV